jgi:hypothetical protein
MSYLSYLIPQFVAWLYLLTALAFQTDTVMHGTFWFYLPPLIIVSVPILGLILKHGLHTVHSNNFLLYLCFLAPFALWYPWVITGGHTYPGYGGFLYFMEWLTKHPNLGPINIQVFIGIICVIALALLPSFYANQALSEKPRAGVLLLLLSLCLIAFAPVFIRLDLMLWITGFTSTPPAERSGGGLYGFDLLYGPLLHTVPLLIMIWHVGSIMVKKPANYY